jgi:hypothetical protein
MKPSPARTMEHGVPVAWVSHPGSEAMPAILVGRRFRVRLRCGIEGDYAEEPGMQDGLDWSHNGRQGDVVAYRIIK